MADSFEPQASSAEMCKLLYAISSGYPKTKNDEETTFGDEVAKALQQSIESKSFDSVNDLFKKEIKRLLPAKLSGNASKRFQVDFMTLTETIKYLGLIPNAALKNNEAAIQRKIITKDMEEDSQVYLRNENLVVLKLCETFTVEQTKQLFDRCSEAFLKNKCETSDNFYKIMVTDEDSQKPGMKELLFLYTIRLMEIKGKISNVNGDRLGELIDHVNKNVSYVPENLKEVDKILNKYEILVKPAGYCLIFCMTMNRPGAEAEKQNLRLVFKEILGYKTNIVENPSKAVVRREIERCGTNSTLKQFDSFICWVLAHGDDDNIVLLNDDIYKKEDFLLDISKENIYPSKPRIIFMGTCRGEKLIPAPIYKDPSNNDTDLDARPYQVLKPQLTEANRDILTVHAECHRVVAYATLPEHVAFRKKNTGSIFVSYICDSIQKNPGSNIMDILQKAGRQIHSIKLESPSNQGMGKQAMVVHTTLQKNFYFPMPR